MPDLATLQSDFVRAILGADRGAACAAVVGDPAFVSQRLSIYRDTVLSGACDALRLSYPVTERLVGTDFFDQTALAFVRQAPPHEPVLARYGAGFPDFLQSLPTLAELPYISDVARLEWAVDQAGHVSPAHRRPGRRFILPVEAGSAVVTLAGSLRLVESATSVHAIWRAVRAGDEEALPSLGWTGGRQWLAVHHADDDIAVTPLSRPAWTLCAALLAGATVDWAIAATSRLPEPFDEAAIAVELLAAPFVRVELHDPRGSEGVS